MSGSSGRAARPPLVLVGLMGAGKSTVGRRLANLCGRVFVDLDEEIVRLAGRRIDELFGEIGEMGFRALEAEATRELGLRGAASDGGAPALIVAAGGGWMTNPAARAALPDAETVWLKVGPAEAARRLSLDDATRPLLDGYDPSRRLRDLLAGRLPAYGEATYTVDTAGRGAEAVAREVAAVAGLALEIHETKREG